MAQLSRLEEDIKTYDALAARAEEAAVLYGLAVEEGDEPTGAEALAALEGVERALDDLEIRRIQEKEESLKRPM